MWLGARRGAVWTFVICALLGLFVLRWAYSFGRARGAEAEAERVGDKVWEVQLEPTPPDADVNRNSNEGSRFVQGATVQETNAVRVRRGRSPSHPTMQRDGTEPSKTKHAWEASGDGPTDWVFTPAECVRVVWPMEIVPSDAAGGASADEDSLPLEGARFRLRQGANRFCRPGTGLAEFAFELDRPAIVRVGLHCRFLDECGNSVRCTVDGVRTTVIGRRKVFGKWLWEDARGGFMLRPGIHRLTLSACEDGIEFDRVVVRLFLPGPAGAERHGADPGGALSTSTTSPPVFESLPRVAPTLPEIGAVTAQAFAAESVVVGSGHRNTLLVYLRRNGPDPVTGVVRLRCPYGGYYNMRGFTLGEGERARLMKFDLELRPAPVYLMPLRAEVVANDELVLSQRIDFVRPLSWAFLGPFPDPEGKGLDLDLPPDAAVATLHTLPEVGGRAASGSFGELARRGRTWQIVEDGSCYDPFGVVDFNKVFGMPNMPWHEKGPDRRRFVAYAVTAVNSRGTRHDTLAFAADDAVRVWRNGRALISVDNRTPIETSRQVVGTPLRPGPNFFVFKVAQRGFYWQLLFEPDNSLPYGRTDNLLPLPVERWTQSPLAPPAHVIPRQ